MFLNFLAREEPKRSDAIIEVDKNDIVPGFLDDLGPVIVCIGISRISTSLDEHPDGQFGMLSGTRRGEHIDKEAILRSR
jgi:hypothetical protein